MAYSCHFSGTEYRPVTGVVLGVLVFLGHLDPDPVKKTGLGLSPQTDPCKYISRYKILSKVQF